MQCVILLGGLGTRMRGVSGDLPKALLPVGPRTFIEWQLEWLKRSGVSEAVLALGYGANLIQLQLEASPVRENFPRITYSYDGDQAPGTGGAVLQACCKLYDHFLVTYGDSILFIDASNLFAYHLDSGSAVTFSIFKNENRFDSSNVEYCDGRIIAYDKANRTEAMEYIDYGMFALNKREFVQQSTSRSFDLAEYLSLACAKAQAVPYVVDERFYEIGSPAGYGEFCAFMEQLGFDLDNVDCSVKYARAGNDF